MSAKPKRKRRETRATERASERVPDLKLVDLARPGDIDHLVVLVVQPGLMIPPRLDAVHIGPRSGLVQIVLVVIAGGLRIVYEVETFLRTVDPAGIAVSRGIRPGRSRGGE